MTILLCLSACHRSPPSDTDWQSISSPQDAFPYDIDDHIRCWLKLNRQERPVIRVNCFAINGVLHTHSNRFVPVANLIGESWTANVAVNPDILVAIEGKVYSVKVHRVLNEQWRVQVLNDRGYWYVPDAIQVYELRGRG